MKDNHATSRLMRGAVILSLAMVVTKLIGTLQKIPLQNIGGDGVFGIYNTVYPFYTLLITLAAAGFPAAVSKFVAEYEAVGDRVSGQKVARLSSMLLAVFGVVLAILTYIGAPWIGKLIDNSHVVPSVQAAAAAFLFVPVMAALRGYFQGLHNMIPTAVSQVTEQTVRVTVMIVLLLFMLDSGATGDMIAAGAILGSAAGGAAGLLVMLLFWWNHNRRQPATRVMRVQDLHTAEVAAASTQFSAVSGVVLDGQEGQAEDRAQNGRDGVLNPASSAVLLRALLRYALPVCLGALAVPLISLVDTFTVPRLLKREGLDEAGVMVAFGIYNRGMPLVQLVMMFATTLSALFIPALAEAKLTGGIELARRQCQQSLRWFWLLGMAAAVGLSVLAVPINVMLYGDDAGSEVMRWMALTAVGGTVSIISAALLQGLGAVRTPALTMLAAAAAKALLNWLLVPYLGTSGAAIAGAAAYLLAAGLNIALLARIAGLRWSWISGLIKPAVALVAMAVIAAGVMWGTATGLDALGFDPDSRKVAVVESLLGVTAGAIVFVLGLARLRLLTSEELNAIPKFGRPLASVLRRLRVLT